MRIIHVGTASDAPVLHRKGGAQQRRIRELAFAQARMGHEVVAYSFGESAGRVERDGVEFRTLVCHLPQPWRQLEFRTRIAQDLRRRRARADVLHLHGLLEGATLPRAVAARRVLSFDYYRLRGGQGRPWSPLTRRLLQHCDALLPVSEHCAAEAATYWDLPRSLMRILPNGVRLDEFRPRADAGTWRQAHRLGEPLVLYVGRLCVQKGTEVLLHIASELRRRVSPVTIAAVGPVEQFGRHSGESDWPYRLASAGVRWLGPLDDDELPLAYSAATVFVMPTIVDEMFGMAVVEAQACGAPVVASDLGGLRETVPSGSGLRLPPGDCQAWATAIADLLSDEPRRRVLAQGGRENSRRFGWDAVAAVADRIYAGIGAGSR